MIADVNETRGQAVAEQLGTERVRFVRTDVTNSDDTRRMVQVAVDSFGGLDYAVNSAGVVGPVAAFADYPQDAWERLIAVNLTGVFLSLQAEVQQMLAQGRGGAIVNIASAMGLVGYGNLSAYTASKHGVVGLTRDVGLELGRHGIRVNAVCPSSTRTPMFVEFIGGAAEVEQALVATNHPIGRIAEPEDMADAVMLLCSSRARFLIGVALQSDGGWTIQ